MVDESPFQTPGSSLDLPSKAKRKRGFSISWGAVFVGLLLSLVAMVCGMLLAPPWTAAFALRERLVELSIGVGSGFLIAGFAGLVSRSAANIAFVLLAPLFVAIALASTISTRAQNNKVYDELKIEQRRMVQDLEEGDIDAVLADHDARRRRIEAKLEGEARAIAEVSAAFVVAGARARQEYQRASEAAEAANVYYAPVFTDKARFAPAYAALDRFSEANQRLIALLSNPNDFAREELKRRNVSKKGRESLLRGFERESQQSKVRRLQQTQLRFRKLDADVILVTRRLIQFLERRHGHFAADQSGSVAFRSANDQATFDGLLAELDDLELQIQQAVGSDHNFDQGPAPGLEPN